MRAGIQNANRARYRELLAQARATADPSPEQLRSLRLAAISAGVHIGGNRRATTSSRRPEPGDPGRTRRPVQGFRPCSRDILPAPTRPRCSRRTACWRSARPHPRPHARAVHCAAARRRARIPDAELRSGGGRRAPRRRDAAIHGDGAAEPPGPAPRRARSSAPRAASWSPSWSRRCAARCATCRWRELASLPEAELRRAAAMVARGEIDPAGSHDLLQAARRANPSPRRGSLHAAIWWAPWRQAAPPARAAASTWPAPPGWCSTRRPRRRARC